jgi:hypothetical protein
VRWQHFERRGHDDHESESPDVRPGVDDDIRSSVGM